MVICKQCKQETLVVCICGLCPKCSGTEELMNEEFRKFIENETNKAEEEN